MNCEVNMMMIIVDAAHLLVFLGGDDDLLGELKGVLPLLDDFGLVVAVVVAAP
jgi:hypothetical protein